jgi:hypothetical protein
MTSLRRLASPLIGRLIDLAYLAAFIASGFLARAAADALLTVVERLSSGL